MEGVREAFENLDFWHQTTSKVVDDERSRVVTLDRQSG